MEYVKSKNIIHSLVAFGKRVGIFECVAVQVVEIIKP